MATSPKLNKEISVATHIPKQEIDISKMSVEEMLALSKQLQEEAHTKGQKLFDDTITLLNDKLKSMGRTKFDAMSGLYALMNAEEKADFTKKFKEVLGIAPAVRKPRAAKGTGGKKLAYIKGVTYKHEANSWMGGTKGRRPPWLRSVIPDGMPYEEAKKLYESLAAK